METEPTLLFKIFDLILQIIVFFVVMGVFGFLYILVDALIKKASSELSPFDSGWSGGGD